MEGNQEWVGDIQLGFLYQSPARRVFNIPSAGESNGVLQRTVLYTHNPNARLVARINH